MASSKFMIKFDPRDIHSVFLWDEKNNKYIEIPNADPEFGHISLDEYKVLRNILKQNSYPQDTHTIMQAHEHLEDIVSRSKREKRELVRKRNKSRKRTRDLSKYPPTSSSDKELIQEKRKERPQADTYVPKKLQVDFRE